MTRAGGVVSLLNTNLVGTALAHCINVVSPKHIICEAVLLPALARGTGNFDQREHGAATCNRGRSIIPCNGTSTPA